MKRSYIYFMANSSNTSLYLGVTSNLQKRVAEHKSHIKAGSFSDKYNCERLVYFEEFEDIRDAISREKQLKNWKREWKDSLIEAVNPTWEDLLRDCGSSPQ
ncbi:MAG: GIY-YIG nuclease family protein [Rikenellaceae bacterium]